MHLNAGALIDVAEGTRSEASVPHLASCDECRRQLADLRAMMSAAAAVDMPEPSPLFWDHLSERVRTVVAADLPRRSWLDAASWRRLLMPLSAGAAASLIVALALSSRVLAPQAGTPSISSNSNPAAFAPPALRRASPELDDVSSERRRERVVPGTPLAATMAEAGTTVELLNDPASDDDVSLMLVASLTADLDLDAADAAGLAPHGSAEHAVTHMNDDELRELRRLLKEQLTPSGA